MSRLEELGISKSDRDSLQQAIREDAAKPGSGPGQKVKAWLSDVTLRLIGVAGRVGESAIGGLIAMAIAQYFALPIG